MEIFNTAQHEIHLITTTLKHVLRDSNVCPDVFNAYILGLLFHYLRSLHGIIPNFRYSFNKKDFINFPLKCNFPSFKNEILITFIDSPRYCFNIRIFVSDGSPNVSELLHDFQVKIV